MKIIDERNGPGVTTNREEIVKKAEELLDRVRAVILISQDESGIPNPNAMTAGHREGLCAMWLSTVRTSKHVAELLRNPQAVIYCYTQDTYETVTLTGWAYEEKSREWLQRLWKPWYDKAFPGGLDDPRYMVYRFEFERFRYYGGEYNVTFALGE